MSKLPVHRKEMPATACYQEDIDRVGNALATEQQHLVTCPICKGDTAPIGDIQSPGESPASPTKHFEGVEERFPEDLPKVKMSDVRVKITDAKINEMCEALVKYETISLVWDEGEVKVISNPFAK